MSANDTQVAGQHYRSSIQHWDYVVANDLDYFQAQITKYVTRWKKKNGRADLLKAQHFLAKYLEVIEANPAYALPSHEVGKAASSEGGGAAGVAGTSESGSRPDPVSGPAEPGTGPGTARWLHPK